MPINQSVPDTIINVLNQTKDKRPSDAIIYGIDGAHADIRLNSSVAIIRHVEVIGNIDSVNIGDTVQITWKSDGRPVIMLVGAGGISSTSGATVVPDNATIENSSFGLRVKKGGISREHLSFIISDEIDVVDSLTRAGWSVDPETGVISQAGISISPTNGLSIGSGNDIVRITNAGSPDDPASPEDDTEYRLWIGHTFPYAAGFAVTKYGDLIARKGSIGGWGIAASDLFSDAGNAIIHAGARPFIGMGASAYGETGFWAGKDTDYIYKVSIGAAGESILAFDGSDLTLQDIDLQFYYGTNLTLWIQSDGDFAIGQDINTVSSTSMRMFSNDQTYNSEAVTAGDVLIGNHDGSHMFWDQSLGQLQFRDGTTTGWPVEVYIDTDGTLNAGGGEVWLDDDGVTIEQGLVSANRVKWVDGVEDMGHLYVSGTFGAGSILVLRAVGSGSSSLMYLQVDKSSGAGARFMRHVLGSPTTVADPRSRLYAQRLSDQVEIDFMAAYDTYTIFNEGNHDIDFIVHGDVGEVLRVDADLEVAQISTWLELAELSTGALPTTGEPGTGWGALYVKAIDGKIYFKNDGGTEYDLTGGGSGGEWSETGGFLTQGTSTDIVQVQNWLELEELGTGAEPATGEPGTGWGAVFAKPDGKVYYKNDGGGEYDLTAAAAGADILEVQVFM